MVVRSYRPSSLPPAPDESYHAMAARGGVWLLREGELMGKLRPPDGSKISARRARELAALINCGALGPEDGFGSGYSISQMPSSAG